MVNTYFKHLNKALQDSTNATVVTDIQSDLMVSAKLLNNNIDSIASLFNEGSLSNELDVNSLLKYYLLNQILKNEPKLQKKIKEDKFKKTANPNIMKEIKTNKFYRIKEGNYELDENIESINEDGSYYVIKKLPSSLYKVKNYFSVDDKMLGFQLMLPDNTVVKNRWQIVEIMNLRKEVVNRYKYAGFSGNSSDLVATILNKVYPPTETGLYMDKHYNLYKWNNATSTFVISTNLSKQSPFLVDYIFENTGIVVRKEYKGLT